MKITICEIDKTSDVEIIRHGRNEYTVFVDKWAVHPDNTIEPTGWTEKSLHQDLTWMKVRWMLDEMAGKRVRVPAFAKEYFEFHTFWGRVRCNIKALFQ